MNFRISGSSLIAVIALAAFVAKSGVTSAATTFSTLHAFAGGSDGGSPGYGLIFDASGALYGTSTGYGTSAGTVFKLTPPTSGGAWTKTVLYGFTGGSDGRYPNGGLIFDGSGAFYGTTYEGGEACCGTAFKLTPPPTGSAWTETVLHSFTYSNGDGGYPYAGLIADASGALYGTTLGGGERPLRLQRGRLWHGVQADPARDIGRCLDRERAVQLHRR